MMRPEVRLCLGVVTTTVVLHAAATLAFVGSFSRCVSSVGVMLHHNSAFQPRYFVLNIFVFDLSLDNLSFQFRYLRARAFVTVLMVVDFCPPVSLRLIRTNYLSAEVANA
jgi:hypothetical protein